MSLTNCGDNDIIFNSLSETSKLIAKLLQSLGLFDQLLTSIDTIMSKSLNSVISRDIKHIVEIESERFDSKIDAFYSDFIYILKSIADFKISEYK